MGIYFIKWGENKQWQKEQKQKIQLFQKLFPSDLRNSLAVYASDIGIFYFLIEMFICVDLLPNEIREHRWIFPISAGYKKSIFSYNTALEWGYAIEILLKVSKKYKKMGLISAGLSSLALLSSAFSLIPAIMHGNTVAGENIPLLKSLLNFFNKII